MDREDKYYIDLGKLGCSDENESLNEKNYPQPNKLYNIDKDTAYWPEDAEDYIYWHSEADKWAEDYAKSYKVKMSPKEFLDLTTTNGADSLKTGDSLGLGKLRDLDVDEFNKELYQNMFLQIAFRDNTQPNVAQVVGHEGRHRMFALMQADVKSVDVELIADVYNTDYDKYKPFNLNYIDLIGQFNKSVKVRVNNPIAMSWKQHKAIRPNLKDESLIEYLDTIRDEGSGTVYYDYPVYVTDEIYKLKSMLQRGDTSYRIYNLDETYYFQDATGNMTHFDMLQYAKDNGYISDDTRISSADNEYVFPEDSDIGYIVYIPKDFKGHLEYHTRVGSDGYYYCKVYSFGNLFVRDYEEFNDGLFKALGEADRTLYYDYDKGTVTVVDKEGVEKEFDIEDDLNGDPQEASTIDLDLKEEMKNNKLIVYRVGQVDDFKQGLFFADSLDYFDYSDTGYSREDAEAYELDLSNAKIFDPMKEWNLSVNTWSDIRQSEEFFKEHNYSYYEYLDEVDYDNENEYHEVMTDTDYLAQYAYEEGYDVCILRDIPGDGGRSSEQTEYFVINKNLIKKVDNENLQEKIVKKGNKWQVQSEKGRNLGTYNTKKEAEDRLKQVHYFKHMNEDLQETDNEGNVLSKEQIEFFKNSKVRDEQGRLIVCYHGTDNDFDTFDISHSGKNGANFFGKGHYFTMSSNNEYGKVQKKCYLNITNPMLGGKSWIDYCKKNGREWYQYPDLTKQLKEDGYDGIIGRDNDTVVAFESNQIKSIDNKNPTNSNNINEDLSNDLLDESLKHVNEAKEDYQKKFDERTHAHIDRVNKYAKKINKEYPHHDEDKFSELYDGYSLMSKNKEDITKEEQALIDDATFKHVINNEHHCEHWVDPKDIEGFTRDNPTPHGCLDCSKMSESALEEMCCDWCAMSEEFGNTPFEWYTKNKDTRWHFNEEQDKFILDTLHKLWNDSLKEDLTESIHLIDKENKNCYYTYSAYDVRNFIDDRLVHGAMSVIKICYFFESDIYLFADGYNCIHEMLEEMAIEQGLVNEDELSERYLVYAKDNDDLEVIDYSEGKVFAYKNFKVFDASYNQTFKKTELYNILSWPVKEFKMTNGMFIKNGKAVTSLKDESLKLKEDSGRDRIKEQGKFIDGIDVNEFKVETLNEDVNKYYRIEIQDAFGDREGLFTGYFNLIPTKNTIEEYPEDFVDLTQEERDRYYRIDEIINELSKIKSPGVDTTFKGFKDSDIFAFTSSKYQEFKELIKELRVLVRQLNMDIIIKEIDVDDDNISYRDDDQIAFSKSSSEKLIDESYKSDYFELGKAGYIEGDGTFIYMDEYHGEEEDLRDLGLPEFSNTHSEEDTCVRIFKEPNEIQYKKLEEVIDEYLDNEEYCKVEIKDDFYRVYSLRENACQDIYQDEIIGNWTGYKLVQFIKNYFSNKSINESMSRDDIEAIVMNKLGTSFEPVEGPSYIMRDGSFLKIWNADIDINGMSGGKSISGKSQHLDVDGLINKQIDSDAYSYFYLNKDCIRTNTGFEQYIVLPQDRPNDAQYKSLLDWMNYYFFDLKHEKLTVMDYYGSWMNHKEYKISDITPEEIIKKIKFYYNTGELKENLKSINSDNENIYNIYYHGSSQKGLNKLTSPINWITEDKDYAKYYALALSDTAYVYICEAELDNIFDAGYTGNNVFALFPVFKPYKMSVEMKRVADKLNLTEEQTYKLIEDALDEYPQDNEYKTRISTIVRSEAFKKLLQSKGYTSIHTIEYNKPYGRYCDCYGILDSNDVKIISSEEVSRSAKLDDK